MMLCGGGDGTIRKLQGSDMAWMLATEVLIQLFSPFYFLFRFVNLNIAILDEN